MFVKDCMTTPVFFVKEYASTEDAIKLMKQYDIGFVPVCSETGELQGVLTDRDFILRLEADSNKKEVSVPVHTIMTKNVVTTEADVNIHEAALVFSKYKVRRLPVLRGKYLVGILSLSDLAKKRILLAEVSEIMYAITS